MPRRAAGERSAPRAAGNSSSTTHSACARTRSSRINSSDARRAHSRAPARRDRARRPCVRQRRPRRPRRDPRRGLEGAARSSSPSWPTARSTGSTPRSRSGRGRTPGRSRTPIPRRAARSTRRAKPRQPALGANRPRRDAVGQDMMPNAHAQDAEMSLREYEDFVFRACHVDGDEDPVAHWRSSADELTARAGELTDTREIESSGLTRTCGSASPGAPGSRRTGRTTCPTAGVFPVETETEARSASRCRPSSTDARSRTSGFASRAAASSIPTRGAAQTTCGRRRTDEGARVLGEFAFGLNYEIDRWTRNILFDEKISGTPSTSRARVGLRRLRLQERLGAALGHHLRPSRGGRDLRRR